MKNHEGINTIATEQHRVTRIFVIRLGFGIVPRAFLHLYLAPSQFSGDEEETSSSDE